MDIFFNELQYLKKYNLFLKDINPNLHHYYLVVDFNTLKWSLIKISTPDHFFSKLNSVRCKKDVKVE